MKEIMFDSTSLPADPVILLSYINTKLRDDYSAGLDVLCDDMNVSRKDVEQKLEAIGYVYDPQTNRFV